MPALLTNTSIRPYFSITSFIPAVTEASLEISNLYAEASLPIPLSS